MTGSRLAAPFGLLAALVILAAGCGTTVPQGTGSSDAQSGVTLGAPQGGSDLAAGPLDSEGNPPAATGNLDTTTTGPRSGGGVSGNEVSPVGGIGNVGGTGAVAAKRPLEIGIYYLSDAAATIAATGANANKGAADPKAPYQVLIDDVNAHGGLLGHKLVPVWAGYAASGSESIATQEQAACATFTQDHHVFAVLLTIPPYDDTLMRCLQKAGALMWAGPGNSLQDRVQFERYPRHAAAGALNLTRAAAAYVEGLWAQGFFSTGSKIGLVYTDVPAFSRAINEGMKPTLARHGLKLADTVGLPPSYTVSQVPASQISSGVLRFSTTGVNRVLSLNATGGSTMFFWMNTAESQGYRPRYGLSSLDRPLEGLPANVPAAQLHGAMATGWAPAMDVPEPKANASAKRCDRLMAARGQPTGSLAWEMCDQVNVLVAAAAAGGAPLTADSVIAGLPRVGTLAAGFVWSVRYGPGQRDGINAAAHLAFDDPCGCFKFTSSPYPLPR